MNKKLLKQLEKETIWIKLRCDILHSYISYKKKYKRKRYRKKKKRSYYKIDFNYSNFNMI